MAFLYKENYKDSIQIFWDVSQNLEIDNDTNKYLLKPHSIPYLALCTYNSAVILYALYCVSC